MRAMKDSGVEWIGKIPEAWEVRKVAQFWKASKGPNAALLTAEFCGEHSGQYPVYSGQTENNGVMGMINSYIFDFGTTGCLFSTTVGAKAMSVSCLYGKFSLSQNCMIMQPITGNCDVRYFFYLFTFIFGYYRSLIPDNMQPSFRIKDFYAYSMLMPSEIEQKEIAVYLDTKCAEIDKVVEQTRATIEEYKKLKQAIITEAVTKGVRGPRRMKPSGVEWIGDIPEEWEVKRIKYVLNNHDALRRPIAAENRSQKGDILYDYYGASGVIDQIDDYIIEGTYILIGEDGANLVLRNLPLVYVAKGKYWVNNHAHILSPKQGIEFDYIIHALESADYTTFITGTAQPKLSQGNLSQVSLPVPTTEEQQEIAAYLDTKCAEIDRIIEKKEQLIEELGSYKKSLIYEYVTGKKEIKIHNYSQNTIC